MDDMLNTQGHVRLGSSAGQPLTRRDGILKVTGAAPYAADARPEGVLHAVTLAAGIAVTDFEQRNGVVKLSGLPTDPGCELPLVFKFECEAPPSIYKTGGMRVPQTPHPRYDPCPSDIQH